MAEGWDHFKKDYRARFCHGGGKKIDIQPGQNVLKFIQDCFESCDSELTISSPCTACCSTPVGRNQTRTSIRSQRSNAGLTSSVKRSCISSSVPASPPATVSSQGGPHKSYLTPTIHGYAADSKKTESPLSKGEACDTLKDAEALCKSPAEFVDPEDGNGALGSPLLVEEAKSSPVHILHFDDQNAPAVVKSHAEVVCLEGPQTGRDEQALTKRAECTAVSSVRKRKSSFSSAFLAAVTTGTIGKRYTASISPPSPPVVKDQDVEIESECEFLIDESDGLSSNSWFSIPQKNKKSKKDGSATPVTKSQSSEKEKTEGKKGKTGKVQAEALTEQKRHNLDVRVQHDFKGASQSDPVSSRGEGNGLKSQKQSSTPVGKSKKDALHQDSPRHRKMSCKPEAEQLILLLSESDTEAYDEEHEKRVMPGEDSPMPSAERHEEQMPSPKENVKSSKYPQSASKALVHSIHKKHTAKQKLQESKDKLSKKRAESQRKKLKKSVKKSSNKKPQLQRGENSDSEAGEEGLEREPVELNEMFTSPLRQKLENSVLQKLASSEKPKNVLHALESLRDVYNKTPVKAAELLQHLTDSIQNSEKKRSLAKSSGKTLKKINHRTHKGVSSNPEDVEPQNTMDSDSSSAHKVARKKHKQSDVKIKSNKRKHNVQRRLQDSSSAVKVMSCESGPVLEHCDEFTSRSKWCEQDNESSDDSEDLHHQIRNLSDKISRHKIVMPSNTPNVRRTKRIRLKPLEYWRGERVNYTMKPSGGLTISGIVCPETEPHRKKKQKKIRHKEKRNYTKNEVAKKLNCTLADTSKPTVVVDPVTNQEVLQDCINTGNSHLSFFKDESVEIYKNLNTSAFSTGKLILKPLKEKGHQFVYMDTIAFHVIHGKIVVTLHKTSYYLTSGAFFYIPAGNQYNIRNLLNEESVLLFTQFKNDRPIVTSTLLEPEPSSP
ncbi:centromere protein C isoform X2 [Oxyura jamaicensis]|uniref:centromere protein C isoform X2 n=1 Tax=Oxyura jamaicensis TaxID=8884 RepID=UPI0015A689CE|nr:centromere protein C isoform X2 [Oxyura jamaicensis]